ncbi:MAG: zinc ribbon domain-containing protein [Desulfurococcaceae archaeon]
MEIKQLGELNARRLGAAALTFYAVSTLIIVLGSVAGVVAVSTMLSDTYPSAGTIDARTMVGLILIGMGLMFQLLFSLYAGFYGRNLILRTNFAGWEEFVKMLAKLYFIATLFIVVGFFVTPQGTMISGNLIFLLISSILILIAAPLVPLPQQSFTAGIMLIISAILNFISLRTGTLGKVFSALPMLESVGLKGIGSLSLHIDAQNVALLMIGIALMIRGMSLSKSALYSYLIAIIAGIIYTAGLAYAGISNASLISSIESSIQIISRMLPEPVVSALWTIYYTQIIGNSLLSVAGILGMIALILVLVPGLSAFLPGAGISPPPTPRVPPPTPRVGLPEELRYCPSCGAPVGPHDIYCSRCGRRLR